MATLNPITGSDLRALVNASLSGYQNAIDDALMYSFLNEGKNEVWMILKELKANYFAVQSQNTNQNNPFYFGPLNTQNRSYTLPADYHEMRLLEVTDVGFEDLIFEWRSFSSVDYQEARRGSTNENTGTGDNANRAVYYWDVIGKNQFVLAQYPEYQPMNLTIWYVRIIPDFDEGDTIDEVLYPYVQKITEYATMKIVLSLQDLPLTEAWKSQWKESVIRISQAAAPRQSANPVFVIDFTGYTIEN